MSTFEIILVITKGTLRDFWEKHPTAALPLQIWYKETQEADWKTPHDVKAQYGNASVVGSNRIVFNVKGNDFRLIAAINYATGIVYIRFIGTHKEYDRIDAATI